LELSLGDKPPKDPRGDRCSGVPEYAYCVNKLSQNVGLQTWIPRHIVTS